MDPKEEAESQVRELTTVYTSMLKELKNHHDEMQDLKKKYEEVESNFNGVQLLTDCIKGRLEDAKRILNMIYNNEEYTPLTKFIFTPELVQE